jgi:hypothetical protein
MSSRGAKVDLSFLIDNHSPYFILFFFFFSLLLDDSTVPAFRYHLATGECRPTP